MPIIRLNNGSGNQNIHYEFDPNPQYLLGEGGMGRVFKGVQVEEGKGGLTRERPVAIKLLFEDLPEHAIKRARREASIRIKNDNLVEMIDFVETHVNYTTRYHVVSELLNGINLDDLLDGKTINRDGSPNPTAERLLQAYGENRKAFVGEVFRSMLSGITALHDAGYIHRDIDPSNIMVTSEGKIKLIDFGIAKKINELGTNDKQLTSAGQFVGKIHYAAPELILGDLKHQSYPTDVYSLGITLFQLYTGHLPFDGPFQDVYEKQLHAKPPLNEVDDKTLRRIIEKALEKDKEKRYQSAFEFRVDIDRWMNEEKKQRQSKEPHEPRKPLSTMPWKKIALVAAGIVAVACLAYYLLSGKPDEPPVSQNDPETTVDTEKVYMPDHTVAFELDTIGVDNDESNTVVTEEETSQTEDVAEDLQETQSQLQIERSKQVIELGTQLMSAKTAGDGLAVLEQLAQKGDYDAAFLLSRLYFDPTGLKGIGFYETKWNTMRTNCGISPDLERAHNYLMKAYHSDKNRANNDPVLLYELCCDFLYGRGVESTPDNKHYGKGCYEALNNLTKGRSDSLSKAIKESISGDIAKKCNSITVAKLP